MQESEAMKYRSSPTHAAIAALIPPGYSLFTSTTRVSGVHVFAHSVACTTGTRVIGRGVLSSYTMLVCYGWRVMRRARRGRTLRYDRLALALDVLRRSLSLSLGRSGALRRRGGRFLLPVEKCVVVVYVHCGLPCLSSRGKRKVDEREV